jgi:protocatechuate 3,4-dioxygenase beta subunit
MTVSPDPRLESARPACRVLPEQTEGPYHRQAPPERVDITEDCEGMPLRVGLRLLDTDAVTPLRDAVVEVWQADATGRYSGFARVEPHADGTPLAAEEISDEQVAPQETFLRGSQRTDAAGTCQFRTIWPGWYSGRTIHIHVIVHLGGGRTVTTQLYFPDELNAEVLATWPYAERGPQDTTNATDTIFPGGGDDTILQLERRDAGWSGVLCLALAEGAGE